MQNSLDEAQFLHPSNEEDKLIKAQVCQFHGQRELHDNLVRRDKFSRALSQDDVESDSEMLVRSGSDDDDEGADDTEDEEDQDEEDQDEAALGLANFLKHAIVGIQSSDRYVHLLFAHQRGHLPHRLAAGGIVVA
jgi:hypothetical protein